jgi:hypothetical protein
VRETQPAKLDTGVVGHPNSLAYAFAAFRLVPKERKLLLAGEPVQLSSRAFDMLVVLVERAGSIIPADELMRLVCAGSYRLAHARRHTNDGGFLCPGVGGRAPRRPSGSGVSRALRPDCLFRYQWRLFRRACGGRTARDPGVCER